MNIKDSMHLTLCIRGVHANNTKYNLVSIITLAVILSEFNCSRSESSTF